MFKIYLRNCSYGLSTVEFPYILVYIDVVIKLPCYFKKLIDSQLAGLHFRMTPYFHIGSSLACYVNSREVK